MNDMHLVSCLMVRPSTQLFPIKMKERTLEGSTDLLACLSKIISICSSAAGEGVYSEVPQDSSEIFSLISDTLECHKGAAQIYGITGCRCTLVAGKTLQAPFL
jgi:hypothetical protein